MSSSKEMLAQMNAERTVVMSGGKVRVLGWEPSDVHAGVMVPRFSGVADLKTFYANKFIQVEQGDGKIVSVPLFDYWLRRADRPTAIGFTIEGAARAGMMDDGRFNLWRGFSVAPRPGDWSLLRRHFEEVLAAGNEEHADYLIRWSYWVMQHPTERAEVVVVLGGPKGIGKGVWAAGVMCRIFGAHGLQISDRRHLVGNFNAHLMQCCLLFADEAFWPGDRDKDGPLKRMITEESLLIEPKGVDAFDMRNRLAIIIAGNEDWLVPASSDERRYAVFKVSDRYQRDASYFKPLLAELANGGLEAFLHDALAADLGDWHPRDDVPQTDALAAQQGVSAPPEVLWLGSLLNEGMLPFSVSEGRVEKRLVHPVHHSWARSRLLFVHATRQPGMARWTEPQFYKFLDEHGIGWVKRIVSRGVV